MAEIGQAGSASARLEARRQDEAVVLQLSGDLDVTTTDRIRPEVDAAMSGGPERVIFDLAGLEFMDSSGIALLVSAAQRAREAEVRNPSAIVRRLIELTGLAGTLGLAR